MRRIFPLRKVNKSSDTPPPIPTPPTTPYHPYPTKPLFKKTPTTKSFKLKSQCAVSSL